jgi:hypothetical protein
MWIGFQRSSYRMLTDTHHKHHRTNIINISSATAHCEPPFPAEASSTTLYPWRPSLDPQRLGYSSTPFIHRSCSQLCCILPFWNPYPFGHFFIVRSFQVPFPEQTCCFYPSDKMRWPVYRNTSSLYLFIHSLSLSCAGAYILRGFPFKTCLNSSVIRSMLWFRTSERV